MTINRRHQTRTNEPSALYILPHLAMSDDAVTGVSTPTPPKLSLEDSRNAWETHPENPYNWPQPKKWRIALLVAAVILLVGLNATSVTTPSLIIAEDFHVADTAFPHSFWPVTVWNTGAAIGPMIGMPVLENFGIRRGYLVYLSTCIHHGQGD